MAALFGWRRCRSAIALIDGVSVFTLGVEPWISSCLDRARPEIGGSIMPLSYDVFVAPMIPTTSTDMAHGESVRTWSPISVTLISGNGVHQYLVESGDGGRDRWLAALDKIEALQPRAVVSGHKRADRPDDPANIEATRQYIRDFDEFLSVKPTPRELYDAMFAKHPTRINPDMLWASANTLARA
jgi:hypothetical protein